MNCIQNISHGTDCVRESGRGLPHSKTLPRVMMPSKVRQVLECASPLELCSSQDKKMDCAEESGRGLPHSKTLRRVMMPSFEYLRRLTSAATRTIFSPNHV